MNFKIKKIKEKSSLNKKTRKTIFKNGVIIIGLFFVGYILYSFAENYSLPKDEQSKISSNIKTDEGQRTNLLFLGIAGNADHGGDLTDSIMIVSIHNADKTISMLNLPRDLFVKSDVGSRKINEVYAVSKFKHKNKKRGLDSIKKAISDFTGLQIHYATVVKFEIFSKVIDEIGGINIYIPNSIKDPFYPDDKYGYKTFTIRSGLQKLDGETALKYIRTRKTTSDYARSQRQQDIFVAIQKRLSSLNILKDPLLLSRFYNLFNRNVVTDLGITEILSIANIVKDLDSNMISSSIIHDNPVSKGGFLYTPAKEDYSGQFILLPNSKTELQQFINFSLKDLSAWREQKQISVLNGTKTGGLAGLVATKLKRLGFHVIKIGNYKGDIFPVEKTILRLPSTIKDGKIAISSPTKTSQFLLKNILPKTTTRKIENFMEPLADLEIVLGNDFKYASLELHEKTLKKDDKPTIKVLK
jgi:LCP family protein required for cell wall assembly